MDCGGCEGRGRHRRWCPEVVGRMASMLGQMAAQANAIGDRIGPNNMAAANMAWQLAAELRRDADARAAAYMVANNTHH